ncbi:enoyl-CoA hydratase/isomerase family protein [Novosphingobium malaysiense]|uniref:Enoyl-CoA hydratase n=1 Tax=Novosphingobium malaysiense TaxID=1348853 RepID=A0A0B1ZD56_9SPHN|nr:enoyl-CoA hydratase-related protein [Novosphingobium malaysiense]KHK88984.1 hypothetical protein LK12_23130 [Novosphingobium malaysiense]
MNRQPGNHDYTRYTALQLDKQEGLLTITLSNPGKRNATTPQMSSELTTIWDDAWQDPEVRVILIQGDGADFCAGADTSRLGGNRYSGNTPVFPMTRNAKKHAYGIIDCEKPVVAKVRGVAYGVGVTLALAADLTYASETARFCDSHVKLGMATGDGGVLLWPAMGALRRAKEALLLGDVIPAQEAADLGLINRALPDDELDAHVDAIIERLLALPPHAMSYSKVSLNLALKQMTGTAFEASAAYQAYTMKTEDFLEAGQALREKRKGDFKGR